MPDQFGNYLGDRATVLPDNTAAMLHFSDQFARIENERRQQRNLEVKEEQQRQNRLQAGISKEIYDKNFLNNDLTNPLMQKQMNEYASKYPEMLQKYGEAYTMQQMHDDAANLRASSQKIKEIHDRNVANLAAYHIQNPGADTTSLANLLATKSFTRRNANGELETVPLTELDSTKDHFGDVLKDNEHLIYPGDAVNKAYNGMFDKEPTIQDAPPVVDANGKLLSPGFKGKVANRLYDVTYDPTGKPIASIKSQDYKIDGKQFIDPVTKQPVKVLPDNIYSEYMQSTPIRAAIEKKVRDELDKSADFNGSGESNFSPDSEYANFLRKKFAYEDVAARTKDRYGLLTPKDDAFGRQMKLRTQARQDANLGIAKQRLGIAQQTLQMRKDKIARGENPDDEIPDNFLSYANDRYGQDVEVEDKPGKPASGSLWWKKDAEPGTFATKRIIPVTADPKDIDIIAGKPNSMGVRPIQPQEFKQKDGTVIKGWEYNPEKGVAYGEDKKEVDPVAVQRTFLKEVKPDVRKHMPKPLLPKPAAPKAAAPVKIKGTDKKLF